MEREVKFIYNGAIALDDAETEAEMPGESEDELDEDEDEEDEENVKDEKDPNEDLTLEQ